MKAYYKTIVISDLHLGIRSSKAKEVVKFLKNHACDKLILNGDIIDGWQLRKSGAWKQKHTRFFKLVMKIASDCDTEIIYLRGNHDDFLDEVIPFRFGSFTITKDHVHESFGKRYYVVHGDIFDTVTTRLKWVAKLGDVGYTFLLWLNRKYNNYRVRKGLPYYSLSQRIKLAVKSAVSFITDFETQLAEVAKAKKCEGIICGHIHHPANKHIGNIHYLNSGDWVESLTALVETDKGEWKIILYEDWLQEHKQQKALLKAFKQRTIQASQNQPATQHATHQR
ncbi:MAG: UDP-2,3-diacylglucosamine diphosphatase [Flavobacteriales bacterium]|nr:UDP-2,3-diacylglucosamine diphosphatase [Flavobacteriales bacterium]MCB9447161.1 UDP-2,3-diacylglucosamine diphosphatase [Flavobacteriales bacterium]